MLLRFIKIHGLGNDLMALSLVSQHAHMQPKHIKLWGDRNTEVGFDRLLIVEVPSSPGTDFHYRIFNADGSEVEQCGNDAHCSARFVQDRCLTAKRSIRVEAKGGIIELSIRPDGQVTADMGPPRLAPAEISLQAEREALSYETEVNGQCVELATVSMGNSHGVLRVENVGSAPAHNLGPQLEIHPRSPKKANISFLRVFGPHHIRLRVQEHGIGETQAYGTGTCAVAVAGIRQGWPQPPVQTDLPGSHLHIEWASSGQLVMTTGPAVRVYEDQVRL